MASLVSQPRRSIQMYWARRNYQRLGSPSRHLRVARLGAVGARRKDDDAAAVRSRLSWSRKARAARVLLLMLSPSRLLARIRDAGKINVWHLHSEGHFTPPTSAFFPNYREGHLSFQTERACLANGIGKLYPTLQGAS
uniref:Uncharacterized protein n=1 Tax=Oryza brachyantha TaxID=4533 RepID=J3MA02_ORYBR